MGIENFARQLMAGRQRSGLTQQQLADATNLYQSDISQMEKGKRLPTLTQCFQLAKVLQVSLQWFLTGSNDTPTELPDLALQLRHLGMVDLHVENISVPGAFRHNEEVMVLALVGNAPAARILEAMPAVLAWNAWNPLLVRAFAGLHDPRVKFRLGWLADIALTIHQGQGFPGGCPSLPILEAFLRRVQLPKEEDSLGYSKTVQLQPVEHNNNLPPVSLRWKMGYPAQLASFRERAERLHALRAGIRFD